MKAAVQGDEFVLAGVEAGQLHGAFNGFGAAVAEESLGQAARSDLRDLFSKIGDRLHVIEIRGSSGSVCPFAF